MLSFHRQRSILVEIPTKSEPNGIFTVECQFLSLLVWWSVWGLILLRLVSDTLFLTTFLLTLKKMSTYVVLSVNYCSYSATVYQTVALWENKNHQKKVTTASVLGPDPWWARLGFWLSPAGEQFGVLGILTSPFTTAGLFSVHSRVMLEAMQRIISPMYSDFF